MPTTTGKATEFITFSRGSLATLTDADGRIKWAPHNLLLASEQFDNAAYTKSNITLTANATAAPNGTSTADLITATSVLGAHRVFGGSTTGLVNTFGCFFKANGYTKVGLRESQVTGAGAAFDLSGSGSVIATYDAGVGTASNASIVSVGNGWFLATVTITCSSAGTYGFGAHILSSAYTSGDLMANWQGDDVSGVYIWGAHLYRSDLGGMQANASAYPYYNPSTPKNLLGYSEAFDNAAWEKSGVLAFGSGSVVNAVAAPNGSLSADLIVESAANVQHFISQNITKSAVNGVYTASTYVKRGPSSTRNVAVALTDGATGGYSCVFDLGTSATTIASIGSVTGWTAGTPSITSLSDGWFRVSFTATTNTATRVDGVIYIADGTTTSAGYTGDGTSGIYLWGAQLSDSASLDPYVPNFGAAPSAAAAHGPRLDYDPVTLAAKGLLVEEQRTNVLLRSEEFNNGAWSKLSSGTGVAPVVTANAGIAPDGTSTADRIVFDRGAGTTSGDISRVFQDPDDPPSGMATFSVWLKSYDGVSSYSVRLISGFNDTNITVTGAWQRFILPSLLTTFNVQIALWGNQNQQTADILAWGAQGEYGAFATSYIPTAAATVTRSADVATIGGSLIPGASSVEGTFVVSASVFAPTLRNKRVLGTNTTSATVAFVSETGVFGAFDGSVVTTANSVTANTAFKGASAYDATDKYAVLNGGTVATAARNAGFALTPINIMQIGWDATEATNYLNGHIRQITYIPRRLSNAELQARTT